ncbi:hypothetical protein GQ53DRAFT_611299, partial [Thozetella sp. PMI_491]
VYGVLGAVYGLTVRSINLAAGLGMVLKSFVSGELPWFINMTYSARDDAVNRMVDETRLKGGNAIIALQFDTVELGCFAQTCAYSTVVVIERVGD